jgi:hypothetical protein
MLRYTLIDLEGNSIVLQGASCPANVDSFSLQFTRHKKYHSVLRSYTISEEFHGEAKKFIDNIVSKYGWNAEIEATVEMLDSYTLQYITLINKGRVSLKNWLKTELKTNVNLEDSSFETKVINREDVEVDYNAMTDLEGHSIANYLNPVINITLRGIGSDSTLIKAIYPVHAFEKVLRVLTGEAYPVDTVKSDVFTLTPSEGKYCKRMISSGKMIRGYDDITIPLSFSDLFDTFNAQSCIGVGFEKTETNKTKAVITDRNYFYPKTLTCEITDIHDLEYEYDEDLIFTKLNVGYSNFEKKANTYGQSEYNNKAVYSTNINQFSKTINIISPYRADGVQIENLRTKAATSENNTSDNDIFVIDCLTINDALISRKQEGFQNVGGIYGEIELYTNLFLSPARMIKAHGSWLSIPFNYDKTKKLSFQKNETISKLETRADNEEIFTKDSADIVASDLEDSILTGRIIKFNCTFNAQILNLINNSPNGLIKIQSYIENNSNFGFIKEIRVNPTDEQHNVELYEAKNVSDIEKYGYLLDEQGNPIMLEDGSLIILEKMSTSKKISQLDEKQSLDDNDLIVIASNGENYQMTGSALKASLRLELNEVLNYTIPANTSEYIITIGALSTAKTFIITYQTERDTRQRAGLMTVKAIDQFNAQVVPSGELIIPEDFGQTGGIIGISADVYQNQVRLKISTDNEDSYNTSVKLTVKAL